MSDKETADLAYWERNMLALLFANGWYYDDDNNWPGWRRVLSLKDGRITFHIPDDFDVGNLRRITPNWDGHTTERKWQRVMKFREIDWEK
jgi:hypothetical protein